MAESIERTQIRDDESIRTYGWMRPAWLLGRLRPGLRAALVADSARLRELPGLLGRWVLPVLAVGLPLLLAIGTATTRRGFYVSAPDPWTLLVYDVFTESMPFMLAAFAIGLATPAAGVLLVAGYVVGDLGATIWTNELSPVVPALVGRLISHLTLWLLVVEIPLLARQVFEWRCRTEDAARGDRVKALLVSAVAVAGLGYAWAGAATLFVSALFNFATVLIPGQLPYRPFMTLSSTGALFPAGIASLTLVILGSRYLGDRGHFAQDHVEPSASGRVSRLPSLVGLALSLLLLLALIDKPIDAVILVVGLLSARPIARLVLRATGAGRLLARIVLPVRLLLGFAVTLLFAWVFLAIVGVSPVSRFFNMVIAVAVGIVIMQIFLGDDDAKPGGAASQARRAIKGAVIGTALLLAMPLAALADNGEATGDAAAATGVAGAAAAAAALAWAFLTGLFSKVPRPISTLEPLASEEGAKAQQGWFDQIQAKAAREATLNGQDDRADQIRNMSTGEFYQAAKNGDFSDLGVGPW